MARATPDMRLTSPAFAAGGTIPREYTADGRNESPPLTWGDPPAGTRGFALVCEDPDAPRGLFTHWVAYNLPPEARALGPGFPPEPELPDGTRQGANGFGRSGYGGPSPPPGRPHRYVFRVLALDTRLDLPSGASRDDVVAATAGHVLAAGEVVGTYGRPAG